jgi:hypothetical protein
MSGGVTKQPHRSATNTLQRNNGGRAVTKGHDIELRVRAPPLEGGKLGGGRCTNKPYRNVAGKPQ